MSDVSTPAATWEVMSEQPPSDGRWYSHYPRNEGQWMNVVECGYKIFQPPHRPGDRIAVREEWAVSEQYDAISDDRCAEWMPQCSVAYKADDPTTLIAWRPAWAMPDWAVRTWLTVVSCEPKRAEQITEEEAQLLVTRAYMNSDGSRRYLDAWRAEIGPDAWTLWGWHTQFTKGE